MYAYLLSYDPLSVDPQVLIRKVDAMTEIENWVAPYPGCIILVSRDSAGTLSQLLRRSGPFRSGRNHFVIADLGTDRAGWLPRPIWDLIRNPRALSED